MPDVLPKWAHRLPRLLAILMALSGAGLVTGAAYYFTPKFTHVGYAPMQPASFSHKTHAAQTGIDCRYCHASVETRAEAGLPSASLCMNCHGQILKGDERLELVRDKAAAGAPVPWVRVHRLPDYVFFNHAAHVQRGVGCVECHGPMDQMEETRQTQPLSMAFCLDCHRNPATRLRPLDQVFSNGKGEPPAPAESGTNLARLRAVNPSQNCAACHR